MKLAPLSLRLPFHLCSGETHLPTTVDRVRGGTSEAVISLRTMINSAVKSH